MNTVVVPPLIAGNPDINVFNLVSAGPAFNPALAVASVPVVASPLVDQSPVALIPLLVVR